MCVAAVMMGGGYAKEEGEEGNGMNSFPSED